MMNNNMIRSIQSHSVSVAVLRTSLLRAQLIDGFKRAFRSSIYWKLYSFFLCVVAVCCWCWCRCCYFVFWCAKSYCANHTREKTYSLPCGEPHGLIVSFSQSVSQPVSSITSMEMERQKTETIETDFEAHARARLLTHSFGTSTLLLGKCLFTAFLSYAVILGVCLLFIVVSYIVKAHIKRAFLAQALLFDFVESRMNTHTHKEVYAVTDILLIR